MQGCTCCLWTPVCSHTTYGEDEPKAMGIRERAPSPLHKPGDALQAADSRQLPPTRCSSPWAPQAEVISMPSLLSRSGAKLERTPDSGHRPKDTCCSSAQPQQSAACTPGMWRHAAQSQERGTLQAYGGHSARSPGLNCPPSPLALTGAVWIFVGDINQRSINFSHTPAADSSM